MATIFDRDVWKRIIEKYNLKEVAIALKVYDNPSKAEEMLKVYKHNFGIGKLTDEESDFCGKLGIIRFTEENFLHILVSTGTQHCSNGANDYVEASMQLVMEDFENSFKDFIVECRKREVDIETIKFAKAYEIFLYVIKLKIKYKIPYTKLFIRKLLELSPDCYKKDGALEIQQYFLKKDSKMLLEVKDELVEYLLED